MSEYKRLTKQVFDKVQGCEDKMTMNGQSLYDLYNRLAELEDKIENGTLIELPCNVGDTIYEVFKYNKPPFIQQTKVEKIIVTEKGLKLKLDRNSFYETSIASLGKTLFLTEEAAEARLKEFQEKNNG
jgi:hypothetical protein